MVGLVDPQGTTNALATGFNFMQGIAQDRARREAGNALASGNVNSAINALGGAGDLQSVRALQADERTQSEAQREREQEERTQKLTFIGRAAESMRRVPADQRDQAWQQLRPVFADMGYPPELLAQMDSTPKTDENLNSVIVAAGREVESPAYQNAGNGYFMRSDPYGGGQPEFIRAPVDPMQQRLLEAQIAAQEALAGQRGASANASNARAGRAGGGGGGGGSRSSGAAPASSGPRRPWERY